MHFHFDAALFPPPNQESRGEAKGSKSIGKGEGKGKRKGDGPHEVRSQAKGEGKGETKVVAPYPAAQATSDIFVVFQLFEPGLPPTLAAGQTVSSAGSASSSASASVKTSPASLDDQCLSAWAHRRDLLSHLAPVLHLGSSLAPPSAPTAASSAALCPTEVEQAKEAFFKALPPGA